MGLRIGIVTTSRADFSIYAPLLEAMKVDPATEPKIIALGTHHLAEFGHTIDEVKSLGIEVLHSQKPTFFLDDSPKGIGLNTAQATLEMTEILAGYSHFEFIIVLGDRFEMLSAALAVVPYQIPLIHIHGGELTLGAMDNKFRHALTKISDYHLTACEKYSDRVHQMGATKNSICNIGSLAVENMLKITLLTPEEIQQKFSIDINEDFILATFHPETAENSNPLIDLREFLAAIDTIPQKWVLTLGHIDTYGLEYRKLIKEFSQKKSDKVKVFSHLGIAGYYSVMKHASMVVGNSSSGIIETATYNIPTVNIGHRQGGREISNNTINCKCLKEEIVSAFKTASKMKNMEFKNIYEQKNSSERALNFIKNISPKTVNEFAED